MSKTLEAQTQVVVVGRKASHRMPIGQVGYIKGDLCSNNENYTGVYLDFGLTKKATLKANAEGSYGNCVYYTDVIAVDDLKDNERLLAVAQDLQAQAEQLLSSHETGDAPVMPQALKEATAVIGVVSAVKEGDLEKATATLGRLLQTRQ